MSFDRNVGRSVTLLAIVVLLAGCSSSGSGGASSSTSTSVAPTVTDAATTSAATTSPPTNPATTTTLPAGSLTSDEANADAKIIIASFNADNSTAIEQLLGDTGQWVGTENVTYSKADVAGHIDPLLAKIDSTEITGGPNPVQGGFSFALRDLVGSLQVDYGLTITKDASGVLHVQETM